MGNFPENVVDILHALYHKSLVAVSRHLLHLLVDNVSRHRLPLEGEYIRDMWRSC